jgi:hypothetical protein
MKYGEVNGRAVFENINLEVLSKTINLASVPFEIWTRHLLDANQTDYSCSDRFGGDMNVYFFFYHGDPNVTEAREDSYPLATGV